MKCGPRKIGGIVRCLLDEKFAWLSSYRYCIIVPKICQGQPPTMYSECSRFHPNEFTFGIVIAERVNLTKTRHKVNPIFG